MVVEAALPKSFAAKKARVDRFHERAALEGANDLWEGGSFAVKGDDAVEVVRHDDDRIEHEAVILVRQG
jgi:hypothetical protein